MLSIKKKSTSSLNKNKVLFIKPSDRFLENEFVYQQLGLNYLQPYIQQFDILSDILILNELQEMREARSNGIIEKLSLNELNMLLITAEGGSPCIKLHQERFGKVKSRRCLSIIHTSLSKFRHHRDRSPLCSDTILKLQVFQPTILLLHWDVLFHVIFVSQQERTFVDFQSK